MKCSEADFDAGLPKTVDQALYGDDPIAILAVSDRCLAGSLRELDGVQVILFDGELGAFETVSGDVVELNDLASPPTCNSVLVAASPNSHGSLSKLSMWWATTGGVPAPKVETVAGATVERVGFIVLGLMLRQALEATRRVSRTVMDLHHQIVALREQNEEAGAIVERLRSDKTEGTALRVSCDPSESLWSPEADGDLALFSFPFHAFGLSQIDLYFRRFGDSVGWLTVTVTAMENDHILGMWEVPYEKLGGWLPLTFPRTLSVQSHYLKVQVKWQSQIGVPPGLALSDQRVHLRGAAAIDAPMDSDWVPAICLYKGIPGQRQPAAYWSASDVGNGPTPEGRQC